LKRYNPDEKYIGLQVHIEYDLQDSRAGATVGEKASIASIASIASRAYDSRGSLGSWSMTGAEWTSPLSTRGRDSCSNCTKVRGNLVSRWTFLGKGKGGLCTTGLLLCCGINSVSKPFG